MIDSVYVENIGCLHIPKLDWNKREEDDLLSHMIEVLRRIENWLKKKMSQPATHKTSTKYSKTKKKNLDKEQTFVPYYNVDDPIAGPKEVEVKETTPWISTSSSTRSGEH